MLMLTYPSDIIHLQHHGARSIRRWFIHWKKLCQQPAHSPLATPGTLLHVHCVQCVQCVQCAHCCMCKSNANVQCKSNRNTDCITVKIRKKYSRNPKEIQQKFNQNVYLTFPSFCQPFYDKAAAPDQTALFPTDKASLIISLMNKQLELDENYDYEEDDKMISFRSIYYQKEQVKINHYYYHHITPMRTAVEGGAALKASIIYKLPSPTAPYISSSLPYVFFASSLERPKASSRHDFFSNILSSYKVIIFINSAASQSVLGKFGLGAQLSGPRLNNCLEPNCSEHSLPRTCGDRMDSRKFGPPDS